MAAALCERAMKRLTLVTCVLTLACAAGASQRSEQLYSRGLVEFHAQRTAEALRFFDQAVQADEQDLYARYYRGVTNGRLGNSAAAIADLRAVVAAQPTMTQASLELGVALVEAGANAEAVQWLERAQAVPALNARASLFLGIAQLRLQRTESARQNFHRAAAADPSLQPTAEYYEGVAYFQDREWGSAEKTFSAVIAARPDAAIGRASREFLDKMRGGDVAAWHVYGRVGFEYDSNVVLAPSDDAVKDAAGISRQEDGRAVFSVGGTYIPWRTERTQLSLGYELYQSVHFKLSDFDLQDHRPSAVFVLNDNYGRVGILGRYDFYLLEDQTFLQEATALPWIEIPERDLGSTVLFYRMRRRDFLKRPFSPQRDAFNHAAGLQQFIYLGSKERYLSAGYQFDREDPINHIGGQFAYDGHEADGGLGWAFPAEVTAELGYSYRHERYAKASNGRRDDEHDVVFVARKELTEHFALTLAYLRAMNDSTDTRFEYTRDIVSASVGVNF